MKTADLWKQVKWVIVAFLVSGLLGALVTASRLRAGPLEIPTAKNTSTETKIYSADFVPGKLWAFTLRSEPDNDQSKPIVFLFGTLNTKVVSPGENALKNASSIVFAYIEEDDLKKFPNPMELVAREEGIIVNNINTVDTHRGLRQLEEIYAKAHNTK